MRPIDADALLEELARAKNDNEAAGMVLIDTDFETLVRDADTIDRYVEYERINALEKTVEELRAINEEYAYGERGQDKEIERCHRLIDALKVEAEATRRVAVESIVAMAMEVTDD